MYDYVQMNAYVEVNVYVVCVYLYVHMCFYICIMRECMNEFVCVNDYLCVSTYVFLNSMCMSTFMFTASPYVWCLNHIVCLQYSCVGGLFHGFAVSRFDCRGRRAPMGVFKGEISPRGCV